MLMEDGCVCGRGQKIARITGRSDDMLVIRGINVFPSQIEHVLLGLPEVGNHFMVYVDRVEPPRRDDDRRGDQPAVLQR